MELIAHRGDNRTFHENTRAAFDSAIARGFRALELDLVRLGDGTVVIFHDFDLLRQFQQEDHIREIDLHRFREVFPDLLTFSEFHELYAGRPEIWVNFEIKDDIHTFHAIRENLGDFPGAVVSSFEHHIVDETILYGFEGAYLLRNLEEPPATILGDRLHVPIDPQTDLSLLEDLEDYDLYCYTVNDTDLIERLKAYPCVKGVFTDDASFAHLN
jgi:glycerophosphoryl diester phosphodiesterase